MRFLRCSYEDAMAFPADYVEVVNDLIKKENAEARQRARQRGFGG